MFLNTNLGMKCSKLAKEDLIHVYKIEPDLHNRIYKT